MKMVRKIPKETAVQTLDNLEQFGFTLVRRDDGIEVWVEDAVDVPSAGQHRTKGDAI